MLPSPSFAPPAALRRASLPLALLLLVSACGGPPPSTDGSSPTRDLAVAGSGGVNAPEHRDAPYVVLVSFDGFRWDYDGMYPTPNLARMAEAGARADRLIPVFPTKTFPTHYSLATGLYAENHGLVGNRFWDPERESAYGMGDRSVVEDGAWYRGDPIWVTAETQGMVAASYFFVGSEADVGGVRPTHWRRYDGSVPNEARVDQVLDWLALPAAERPHLVTLYFSDVDGAGHRYGPGSPEVGTAVAEVDRMLGRLLDGLAALPHGDRVYVLVVSDHGMLLADPEKVHLVDPEAMPGVHVAELGPYASFFVEGGREAAVHLRDSLRTAIPAADVWLRGEVPARFHYSDDPRIGDVVALMEPEWTFVPPGRVPTEPSWTHGWDNRLESMGGVFFAVGPGIRPGLRVEPFESVHVYPFVAHLLGLDPAPVDGRLEVLAPLLEGDGGRR